MPDATLQDVFKKFKAVCVPLLENWQLNPASIPRALSLLTSLQTLLQDQQVDGAVLPSSLVSYAIFPLTSILQRNPSSAIPDQVMEKLLLCLGYLCESWWWECDVRAWEQIFMLCGAVVGGIEGKGKGKDRDDETKDAAVRCLHALTRERREEEDPLLAPGTISRSRTILTKFQAHSQSLKFIPVLGQTVNYLIATSSSPHLLLQRHSLEVLHELIALYASDGFIPSIVPGVVSTMTKVALGISTTRGWANGDVVTEALLVLQAVITRSIGDRVCVREGAIRDVTDLDDLASLAADTIQDTRRDLGPYSTPRTASWLQATTSQLLIALNTLTPLVSHTNPSALRALAVFSSSILFETSLTFPSAQPLLLSFLLSISNSFHESAAQSAVRSLQALLGPASGVRHALLQTLLQTTRENLSSLPRLLMSHSDAKVEHVAGQVEAVCRLPFHPFGEITTAGGTFAPISKGVGTLLGPMGGVEKWGWRLLSVLEFESPSTAATGVSEAQLMLESNGTDTPSIGFPHINLRHVATRSTQQSLERMFRALGKASGDDGLYAVEWFIGVGRDRRDMFATAALWCGCRLLEGISGVDLYQGDVPSILTTPRSRKSQKMARGIARSIADLWDESDTADFQDTSITTDSENLEPDAPVEHVRGLISQALDPSLRIAKHTPTTSRPSPAQRYLLRALSLHLLSITSGILQANFTPLLLHTLYPVLHSVISPVAFLSVTGLAALSYITASTSYASPANLLLSNFDYALDAVSRRLSRQMLDIDATKVLVVLIRLVGRDVVTKAGDVVEECFDRLDEYHGYGVVVEGLIEVLAEVVKVVEEDEDSHLVREADPGTATSIPPDEQWLESFSDWLFHRNDTPPKEERDTTDYGPVPHEPWGKPSNPSEENDEAKVSQEPDPNDQPPPTPTQALTTQIVSRSMYFLTHSSPMIRARILVLLTTAVPVLPESALLPSIHKAWPFILNRLSDPEPYVVSATAGLVEALATGVGSFMHQRVWDDIWPRFKKLLSTLNTADSQSALARRAPGTAGTESAYTHSHRLYRSVMKTMTAAIKYVRPPDLAAWEASTLFRRFLHAQVHEELQACAKQLYEELARNNADAVWLVLSSTGGMIDGPASFLREEKWDVRRNAAQILASV